MKLNYINTCIIITAFKPCLLLTLHDKAHKIIFVALWVNYLESDENSSLFYKPSFSPMWSPDIGMKVSLEYIAPTGL